jgi:hypothetical protein
VDNRVVLASEIWLTRAEGRSFADLHSSDASGLDVENALKSLSTAITGYDHFAFTAAAFRDSFTQTQRRFLLHVLSFFARALRRKNRRAAAMNYVFDLMPATAAKLIDDANDALSDDRPAGVVDDRRR